jgi:hypothetical protein
MLRLDFAKIDSWQSWRSGKYNKTLWKILKGRGAEEYLRVNKKDVLNGDASVTVLKTLLHLTPAIIPSIAAGLKSLWQPSLIVFLQLLWITVFLYTGKSQVTGSQISFHVIRDRI